MIRAIPLLEGRNWINGKIHFSELSTDEVSPGRFVPHGLFKGCQDCRGRRCYNSLCKSQGGYARCTYCTTLPYVSSKLRNSLSALWPPKPYLPFDLWRARRGKLDTKLRLLIDELQEFAEADFMSFSKLSLTPAPRPVVCLGNDENVNPKRNHIMKAKGCFVKMRAKFWAGQANEEPAS